MTLVSDLIEFAKVFSQSNHKDIAVILQQALLTFLSDFKICMSAKDLCEINRCYSVMYILYSLWLTVRYTNFGFVTQIPAADN